MVIIICKSWKKFDAHLCSIINYVIEFKNFKGEGGFI